jgi:hypothetical protein
MAIEYTNLAYQHRCYYKQEFPVDVVGRVSNGEVHSYDTLARRGIILAKNPHLKLYRVRDVEKGWETWIPFEDVSVGEKYANK